MSVEEQINLIDQQMAAMTIDRNFIGYNQVNGQPNIDVTPRMTVNSGSYQVTSASTNSNFYISPNPYTSTVGQVLTAGSSGTPQWIDYYDALQAQEPQLIRPKVRRLDPTSSLRDFIVDEQGGWMIPEWKKEPEKYNFFTSLKLIAGANV